MPEIYIRKFEIKDKADVRRISHETALPEIDRSLFIDDKEILADALTLYYTDYEPKSCFVACDGSQVRGYIIGTLNVAKMEKVFLTHILPRLIAKSFRRGLFVKGKTYRVCMSLMASVIKGEFAVPPFTKSYPAMLHINIDKECRGKGLGGRLIDRYVDFLKSQDAPGVHFGTMSEGAKIFFLKSGFELLYQSKRSYLKYKTGPIVSFYIFGKKL